MRRCMLAACILTVPLLLHAINETDFDRTWQQLVGPYVDGNAVDGDLAGGGGVKLRWRAIEQPSARAAIVLLGGHAESFYKYAELFYDLRDMDLSIYALDPRGQGASQHLLSDPEKSHVERWQDYVADLKLFVDTVVKRRAGCMLIGMGHSLGGGIMAAYLEAFPGDFDSAILCSPLLGHRAGGAAFLLLGLLDVFGGRSYMPGGGPFRPTAFEQNKETHSMARHDRKFRDYTEHPEIRMGDPTIHWMMQTRRMARAVQAGAAAVACPTLVLQAGEEAYVDGRAIEELCGRIRDCRRVFIPDARHELLIEADGIRDRVLTEIQAFITSRSGAGGG